jgi:hypothetical protein
VAGCGNLDRERPFICFLGGSHRYSAQDESSTGAGPLTSQEPISVMRRHVFRYLIGTRGATNPLSIATMAEAGKSRRRFNRLR